VEGAFAYGFTGGLDEAAAVAPDLAYGLTGMEGLAVAVAAAGAGAGAAAAADTPEPEGAGLFLPAQANCGTGDAFASIFFRASSRVGISKGMMAEEEWRNVRKQSGIWNLDNNGTSAAGLKTPTATQNTNSSLQ